MARRRSLARPLKVLELYAGIGGVAATGANVVAAIDQDVYANALYTQNFEHPAHRLNLVSVKTERLASFNADLWWMSPPCQPFTIRGAQRDVDDRRCESFLALLDQIPVIRPDRLILENVPGFEGSIAHARFRQALRGYHIQEVEWCPTDFGFPVERRRFYAMASLSPIAPPDVVRAPQFSLADVLEGAPPPITQLDDDFAHRFMDAFHVVDAEDPNAIAACFTRAYATSPVYAGSYLRQNGRVRRFSPREIARLHGFPDSFILGEPTRAYRLLGNSLAVHVVARLLRHMES